MTELQREFELATRAERRNQEMLRQKLLAKVGDAWGEKCDSLAGRSAFASGLKASPPRQPSRMLSSREASPALPSCG